CDSCNGWRFGPDSVHRVRLLRLWRVGHAVAYLTAQQPRPGTPGPAKPAGVAGGDRPQPVGEEGGEVPGHDGDSQGAVRPADAAHGAGTIGPEGEACERRLP